MASRDDYPLLEELAVMEHHPLADEADRALDEIDSLRAELAEAVSCLQGPEPASIPPVHGWETGAKIANVGPFADRDERPWTPVGPEQTVDGP